MEKIWCGKMDSVRREAFFALIAPIGIDLDLVIAEIEEALKIVNYRTNIIKFTDYLKELDKVQTSYPNEVARYNDYIKQGDALCEDSQSNDIFAKYGISKILEHYGDRQDETASANIVHIFRQIKRVDEIKTFDRVYGRNIIKIGCYASKSDRALYLINKMLKTERDTNRIKLESQALDIISTDEDERDKLHGQKIADCYPYSDFIIDCTSKATVKTSARRLVEIYFGHPFISPEEDEYCSYIANAASYRSLDLSRQVGAAIFGENCEIISMGCNEVPRSGGGTYWSSSDNDKRDYAIGYDSNQKVREDMARDALMRLGDKEWLAEPYSKMTPDELVMQVFSKDPKKRGPLFGSMLADIIEYGRMVHAEMNALADAARFRKSTQGGTLYCTTMPCHMCTKLIISAGIRRVVFLQPYGKSLVSELFDDSVSIDSPEQRNKVQFETLKGVTPNGFKRAFQKTSKRKNGDGTAVRWDARNAEPIFVSSYPYYITLELNELVEFRKIAVQLGQPPLAATDRVNNIDPKRDITPPAPPETPQSSG